MAAPALELGAIEGRMGDLLRQYPQLDDLPAYAMATAGLSDYQVERTLVYLKAGLYWEQAIYEASQDQEPPPLPRPAVLPPHITVERARASLSAALCYYSLIRYVGGQGSPVVGVAVICPGRSYHHVKYTLARSGILPRSRRWKRVAAWLNIERTSPPMTLAGLEYDGQQLAADQEWSRFLSLDAPQAMIASPRMMLNTLYAREVMGKAMGTMTDAEIEAELEQEIRQEEAARELAFTPEDPDDHYMIAKALQKMDLTDVRYWMKRLKGVRGQQAQFDRDKLKDRLFYILTMEKSGLAEVVMGILADAEQVRSY